VKAVLDTNVLVSGIFFGGPPSTVLESWSAGRYELIVSPSILDEYLRTCERLASSYPGLEYESILAMIAGHGTLVPDATASESVTADPDDDKFLLCARDHEAIVVSGDRHVLDASGWSGVQVLRPRDFLAKLGDSTQAG
jgi:putative PIN family toxin of toxin-antitoxin system